MQVALFQLGLLVCRPTSGFATRLNHVLPKTLFFLSEHILETEIEYSIEVQGLINAGLMLQTVYDAGGGQQKYGFTELAHYVDRYAVSYNRVDRYVNPREPIEFQAPKIEMKNVPAVFS